MADAPAIQATPALLLTDQSLLMLGIRSLPLNAG